MWTESLRRFRGRGNCLTASCPRTISRIVSRKPVREMNTSQYPASPDYIVFINDRSDVTNDVQFAASGRTHGVNSRIAQNSFAQNSSELEIFARDIGRIFLAKRNVDWKGEIHVKSARYPRLVAGIRSRNTKREAFAKFCKGHLRKISARLFIFLFFFSVFANRILFSF